MAITSAMTALFGLLPGPLVYGYLYDISCTLFRDHDHNRGDCLQYDIESIKNYVMRLSGGLSVIPFCIDVALVLAVKNLNLYIEPPIDIGDKKTEEEETSL